MAARARGLVCVGVVAVVMGWAVAVADAPAWGSSEQDASEDEQDARGGPALYQEQCGFCHGPQGTGTNRGPPLVDVGAASADFYLRSGRMPLPSPRAESRRREPVLTDSQIRELVDYVDSLGGGPPIPELDLGDVDLARGGELYRLHCAACHNWDGKGGALMNRENAPPLHGVPPTQLAEAVRVGPGTMPEFGADTLTDAEVDDIIAYASELEAPEDRGGYHWGHWGPATETVAGFLGIGVLLLVTAWLGERG